MQPSTAIEASPPIPSANPVDSAAVGEVAVEAVVDDAVAVVVAKVERLGLRRARHAGVRDAVLARLGSAPSDPVFVIAPAACSRVRRTHSRLR